MAETASTAKGKERKRNSKRSAEGMLQRTSQNVKLTRTREAEEEELPLPKQANCCGTV